MLPSVKFLIFSQKAAKKAKVMNALSVHNNSLIENRRFSIKSKIPFATFASFCKISYFLTEGIEYSKGL